MATDINERGKYPLQLAVSHTATAAVQADAAQKPIAATFYNEAHLYLVDMISSECESADALLNDDALNAQDVLACSVMSSMYLKKSAEISRREAELCGLMEPATPSASVHHFVENENMNLRLAASMRHFEPGAHDPLLIPFAMLNLVTRTIRHGSFINNTVFAQRGIWEQYGARLAGITLKKDALTNIMLATRRFNDTISREATPTPDQFNSELQIYIDALGRSRELLKPFIQIAEEKLTDGRSQAVTAAINRDAGLVEEIGREHRSASDASGHEDPADGSSVVSGETSAANSALNESAISEAESSSRAPSPTNDDATAAKADKLDTSISSSVGIAENSSTGTSSTVSSSTRFSFLKGSKAFFSAATGTGTGTVSGASKPPPHPKPDDAELAKPRASLFQRALTGISKSVSKTAQALNMSSTAYSAIAGPDLCAYALLISNMTDSIAPLQAWMEAAVLGTMMSRLQDMEVTAPELIAERAFLNRCASQLALRQVQPSMWRIVAFLGEVAQLLLQDTELLAIRYLQLQTERVRRADI